MRAALAAIAVAGCAGAGAPSIDQLTPATGRRGDAVVVHGDGFCVPDCDGSPMGAVDFGLDPLIRATALTWDATAIQVIVPQSVELGTTEVIVTVNDRSSNAVDFEVVP